jgi:hypothetical protein
MEGNLIGSRMKKTGFQCVSGELAINRMRCDAYSVVEDPVQVTFVGIKFHSPAMDIPRCIG